MREAQSLLTPGWKRCLRLVLAPFFVALFAVSAGALDFPELTGRVVDEAGILDSTMRASLDEKLGRLETGSTDQLVVVTVKSLQGTSIEDYGYQLGRHWRVGQQNKNNGALLIVAPNERKVRIEVGYGLEGSLTDAVTKLIIENAILPRFRVGDFSGGVTRGVDDIISVLTGNAEEWKERAAKRPESTSKGIDFGTLVLIFVIFIIMIRMMSRGSGSGFGQRRRRGFWGGGPVFFPGSSSGGGWGGGGGGGGFSGGGGSFGGGGSSGSW
jgi:uncharacterized protein